jgi:outer membrane usher protein FimD/PapC
VKNTDMEHFFEKLKTDEGMSDAKVAIAKEKFESQGITFKQLMNTGDLAITDEELERIGISQLGLRKAILAVIKSNQ